MKKKHTLLAISVGTAIGLFIGVNTDFEKSNILEVVGSLENCIRQVFISNPTELLK